MKRLEHEPRFYLCEIVRLYIVHPRGVTDDELATLLDVSRATIFRYRQLIVPDLVSTSPNRYTLCADDALVDMAHAVLHRARHTL